MTDMRRSLRAFAQHSQTSEGRVIMWDTVDDGISVAHGVVKRSYSWCRYYSALSWIGSGSAVTDAEDAFTQTIQDEPLGALAFLKDENIVKLQQTWKTNDTIAHKSQVDNVMYKSLEGLIPGLTTKLLPISTSCRHRAETSEVVLHGGDIDLTLPQRTNSSNAFDTSIDGHSYSGLGCFAIGLECSAEDLDEIVVAQRRLAQLNLLQEVKKDSLRAALKQLQTLHTSSNFVLCDEETRQALANLISLMENRGTTFESANVKIFTGLRSGFRSAADRQFWGVYDTDELQNAPGMSDCIIALCQYLLLDAPSMAQLRRQNAFSFMFGETTVEDLISSRISWYRSQGREHPSATAAFSLFNETVASIENALMKQQSEKLSQLQKVLSIMLQPDSIDAAADLFALAVFCAIRKLAFHEVYLEVLDRNPLPNAQPDQAGCFAEMFALGSRCEAYFDVTPTEFGRILASRYDVYYKQHQPPMRDDLTTEIPTAYASKQVDLEVNAEADKLPMYYQFTFLGMFAFPALVDIVLLTTLGRGLYLSTYMNEDEKFMATTALMISLFLTGGIGTWVASGGSYYLYAMAYPAMNMFVITRWIAGVALCCGAGILGFVVIAAVKGPYLAAIFFLYLILLTTYLSTLATMAIYQLPGFMFQSGRIMVAMCIPILFVSPLVTLWVGHDTLIYLCVLAVFVVALLNGSRKVLSKWSSWYLDIPFVTDKDITNWYTETMEINVPLESGIDVLTTPIPRLALMDKVTRELQRPFWVKATSDQLVLKVASGHKSAKFLLSWYCKYSRTEMPFPYSTTWNLQCKAAVDTLQSMQKGLRLHSAFVHWRHSGDEVYCGVLYFVIALMDKWVALFTGGSLVGLSAADSDQFRLAVGFSLAYYLISAIFLDAVAHPLWARANKLDPIRVDSLDMLQEVEREGKVRRRRLYWTKLTKFGFLHAWAMIVSSALMWFFEDNTDATIMYLGYWAAYMGLLFYQFNRIFTGTLALPDLLVASVLGLITGPVMKYYLPWFPYWGVVALGVSTWTAGLLSLRTAKVGWFKQSSRLKCSDSMTPQFFCNDALAQNILTSPADMGKLFDDMCNIDVDHIFRVNPSTYPGVEVKQYLSPQNLTTLSPLISSAFTSIDHIMTRIVDLWESAHITVELVLGSELSQEGRKLRYIARSLQGQLHIFLPMSFMRDDNCPVEVTNQNCKIIAETILQAFSESILAMPRDQSILTQLTISPSNNNSNIYLSASMEKQMREYPGHYDTSGSFFQRKRLNHLILGLDCDKDWDNMPLHVRSILFRRCLGLPCKVNEEFFAFMSSKLTKSNILSLTEYIHRCNLGVYTIEHIDEVGRRLRTHQSSNNHSLSRKPSFAAASTFASTNRIHAHRRHEHITRIIPNPVLRLYQSIRVAMKFFIVSIVADPEFQRELDYVMSDKPRILRWPLKVVLNGSWITCKALQEALLPLLLIHDREHFAKLSKMMKGVKVTKRKGRVLIQDANGVSTCFSKTNSNGGVDLYQYSGQHLSQPETDKELISKNSYTDRLVLSSRVEYSKATVQNEYTYEYARGGKGLSARIPVTRRCIRGANNDQLVEYDDRGYMASGSYIKDGNFTRFTFWYRENARFDDELLRAEYVLPHMTIKISWCVPSRKTPKQLDKAIPNSNVVEATFFETGRVHHSRWTYDHKSHPAIITTLNGAQVETPAMIKYDWFDILKKPKNCNIFADNPILLFHSLKGNFFTRMLGLDTQQYPISTSLARANLWKAWKNSKKFDAITTRWLDERTLRSDRILQTYWNARDTGRLSTAEAYLDAYADTVMARVDIDSEISAWTPFALKTSDLYTFGTGGDAVINTRRASTQVRDQRDTLHVLAVDTGTYPNEGGGVSACRRDMVNDLKTIRWHIVAECANDYGFPKFQIERNVQSLTILPLWGLDYLTPNHGIFQKHLDSAVQEKSHNTSDHDIRTNFIPILTSLVQCARAVKLHPYHIEQATKALLDLNGYFETYRHWSDIWMSDVVKSAWRELWLTETMENTRPLSQWLEAERPTLGHLDNALDMWQRYLFIFSLPVPEKIPDVVQASHHFAAGSYGIICKIKRGSSFHVWDHCIAWREVTVFLSSAMSFDAPFVCSSLISLSRILGVLQLHYADVVLPCADFFNPGWEIEIGSIEGTLCHRKEFARKIDPVVNGICNMDSFQPIKKITSAKPTVVMLSHIRFVKDIKNAILAADIIVNEWGLSDYRLDIYGDMERAPAYATECQEIIAAKGLRDYVVLRGLGSPSKVLEQAWLFLNSSVSEGLPLAMGEAALTGVPVVCTDVGASFRVVTDSKTGEAFSAVCPPNDPYSLARAQISIIALLGGWAKFADDPAGFKAPDLPLKPTAEQSAAIMKRMYEKQEQRRALGMRGRSNVLENFSSDRYLREHEQMLWIAKYQSQSYRDRVFKKVHGLDFGVVGTESASGSGSHSRTDSEVVQEKQLVRYGVRADMDSV
ncbi:hypothetical protein LTR05_008469 [Lithohypha guttulata]|uniref:Glycosyl transferase n=1 Tax=Lithohypha guttulata TaxID=1690604 RepID=A0AAN7QCJ4_9EURO|nr:hypothetical protein LTR05_008469 [Lithohypha guttulata]